MAASSTAPDLSANVSSPFSKTSKLQLDNDNNAEVKHHYQCLKTWLEPLITGVKWVEHDHEPSRETLYNHVNSVNELVKPDMYIRLPVQKKDTVFTDNSGGSGIVWNAWLCHSFVWAPLTQSIADHINKENQGVPGTVTILDLSHLTLEKTIIEKVIRFIYTGALNFKKSESESLKQFAVQLNIKHLCCAIQSAIETEHSVPFHNGRLHNNSGKQSGRKANHDRKMRTSPLGHKTGKNRGAKSGGNHRKNKQGGNKSASGLADLKTAMEFIKMFKS